MEGFHIRREYMKKRLVESKTLGIMVKEDVATKLDKLVASLPRESRTIKRKSLIGKSEEVDTDKREEVSTITTDSVDLEGDVILPKKIDRFYYNTNPIVCLNHDMHKEVGRCKWIID